MNKIFKRFNRILFYIVETFNIIGCVFLIISVSSIAYNIIMRYIFNSPVNWAEEVSVLALILFVYFAIPKIEYFNNHLALQIIYVRLPFAAQRVINILRSLFTVCVFAFMSYHGYLLVLRNFKSGVNTQVLGIPYGYIYVSIPIMFALIAIVRLCDPLVLTNSKDLEYEIITGNDHTSDTLEKENVTGGDVE